MSGALPEKTGVGGNPGTAEGALLGRALHALHAESPVLDDTWAVELLAPELRALARDPDHERKGREASGFDFRPILALSLGSLRYAEDEVVRCAARGVGSYIVLGAGFDTFALRRADLADRLRVVEVDHPDVQALKRERIASAARRPAQHPRFVAVDFETMSLARALSGAGFAAPQRSVWSWMNTIHYLSAEATEQTLRQIVRLMAPGSRLVLNYSPEVPLSRAQSDHLQTLGGVVDLAGEPMRSRWKPAEFEALLSGCGLRALEHASEADLDERYFRGRSDGLVAGLPTRLVTAEPVG